MSYSRTLHAYQPCSTCASCRPSRAPTTITPKVTRLTAIFSEDWNWTFNSKDHRSRRQRFANSGERISGFTAVFSDNWKDDVEEEEEEDEVPLRVERAICPHSHNSLQWDRGHKRKRGADNCTELLNARHVPCKRKFQERSSATSPRPRTAQFEESDSESWPPIPAALDCLTLSSTASTDYDETPALSPAMLQHPIASLSGPVYPKDIDMTMWTETERNLYLSLAAEDSRDLSFALQDLSSEHQEVAYPITEPASSEPSSPRKDECGIGDQGFDFWDQFMECYIAGEGESLNRSKI